MKRLYDVCISLVCVLAISAGHSSIAASSTIESVKTAAANAASQSPNDILPGGGVVIVSAAEGYAWRVWPGGKIEYSFDSSRTWEVQNSGVTTDLTAGSAPSGKVCWVVGKAGTVLLTTDRGRHWKRLASPIKEDVGGVFAQDGKHASIWNASHKQSFGTNDGGVTWTPNDDK
jgi:photosystem II stability/assembly factor-like uncharacterized protein